MAIDFHCECGKWFRTEDRYAGKRWICPGCERELLVAGGALAPPAAPVEAA